VSHIAQIDLEFKDVAALRKAADHLGFELVENAETFRYYAGQHAPCIHKLKIKGATSNAFEIGFRYTDNTQTTLAPFVDFYGHEGQQVRKMAGDDLVGLKQRYAAELSAAQLRKQGYRVAITAEDQKLRVRATK
jgi:hypothetical protein